MFLFLHKRVVMLIDYDGAEHKSSVTKIGDYYYAKRHMNEIRLRDDGTCSGASYVTRWYALKGMDDFGRNSTENSIISPSLITINTNFQTLHDRVSMLEKIIGEQAEEIKSLKQQKQSIDVKIDETTSRSIDLD